MPSTAPHAVARQTPVHIARLTLVLGALTAFAPFATDMYLVSFPALAASFHADSGQVQLGLSLFFVGLAVGQLFYGPLIDRYGRKLPLLAGTAFFAATSFLIVFAPDIESFIALRLLQAIGGCAGMVVSRAIITDLFDERETARILSLMMTVQGLAPILAPVLGGYILIFADWRAIFLFLAVFGAICFAAASTLLPETLPRQKRQRMNLVGVLTIYVHLLGQRRFIAPTLAGSLSLGSIFAFISGSPFVFMEIHQISPQHYGWLFGANAFGMIVAAQLNRFLLNRLAPSKVLAGALGVQIVAIFVALVTLTSGSLFVLLSSLWISLATIPLVAANATALGMAASGKHAGSASALVGVLQFGVAGIVSALVGVLHDGTALPMVGTIFACGLLAGGVLFLGRRRAGSSGTRTQ